VVPYDLGAASVIEIVSAARSLCEVVFVADSSRAHVRSVLSTMRELAEVHDTAGMSAAEVCGLVKEMEPDGVVTFCEYEQRLTAAIAQTCGLVGHTVETVDVLTDKLRQRRRLAEHHVQNTRCALVRGPADLAEAAAEVGFPAVLKPRSGAASIDTREVRSVEDCATALGDMLDGAPTREYVLEELLVGDPESAGPRWGDYVSVESVTQGGVTRPVCITGKFPLLEPFRETGFFLPATVDEALAQEITELERAALRALGIRDGVSHTEIKLTPTGPRIIEVNGRTGGYVSDILLRATGCGLIRLAMQVALGMPAVVGELEYTGVTFQRFVHPVPRHGTVATLAPIEELEDLPGVTAVKLLARPGQVMDWRQGTFTMLAIAYGTAQDHDELFQLGQRIHDAARTVCAA
jgi:biotin carboxylase